MNRTDVLAVLETFTTVRKRMISRVNVRVNVKESAPSLQSLARDAMLLAMLENNSERLVSEVVAKLGEMDITAAGRKLLLAQVISVLLWIGIKRSSIVIISGLRFVMTRDVGFGLSYITLCFELAQFDYVPPMSYWIFWLNIFHSNWFDNWQ